MSTDLTSQIPVFSLSFSYAMMVHCTSVLSNFTDSLFRLLFTLPFSLDVKNIWLRHIRAFGRIRFVSKTRPYSIAVLSSFISLFRGNEPENLNMAARDPSVALVHFCIVRICSSQLTAFYTTPCLVDMPLKCAPAQRKIEYWPQVEVRLASGLSKLFFWHFLLVTSFIAWNISVIWSHVEVLSGHLHANSFSLALSSTVTTRSLIVVSGWFCAYKFDHTGKFQPAVALRCTGTNISSWSKRFTALSMKLDFLAMKLEDPNKS